MTAKVASCLLLISLLATGARAEPALPKTLSYSFYVAGEKSGHAHIQVTETKDRYIFESETRALTGLSIVALNARTIVDKKTLDIVDFKYQGTKGDHVVTCQAQTHGDSAYGFVEMDGVMTGRNLEVEQSKAVLFEDWIMEHEIVLAMLQARSDHKTDEYGLIFTSTFMPVVVTTGYSGDVLVEAGANSLVARKLQVAIQGAQPFESQVDPKRGVPVYLRFPTAAAEIFLDEVFGENPLTYYTAEDNKTKN